MQLTEIQKNILKILADKEKVSIPDLQKQLNLKISTLYYNIEAITSLCIRRVRGGIELFSEEEEIKNVFHEKMQIDRKEKEEIAEKIINEGYIKPGDITLLDCGTTNLIIFNKLIENAIKGLDIITVNPYILQKYLNHPEVGKVSLVGGILDWPDGSIFGPLTVNSLNYISEIGTVILGIDAVDPNGELGINNQLEVAQKKVMIQKARRIILPLTQNKLDRAVSYSVGNLNDLKDTKTVLVFYPGKTSERLRSLLNLLGNTNVIFAGE